jgi:hypothetical protein
MKLERHKYFEFFLKGHKDPKDIEKIKDMCSSFDTLG